mmetsp:Transcript_22898/g.64878  ORF Transcript_22898/g.64878 Transcript_22898/m.64878 type:complete len:225 (-) Transcript_22898:752-1426(-)
MRCVVSSHRQRLRQDGALLGLGGNAFVHAPLLFGCLLLLLLSLLVRGDGDHLGGFELVQIRVLAPLLLHLVLHFVGFVGRHQLLQRIEGGHVVDEANLVRNLCRQISGILHDLPKAGEVVVGQVLLATVVDAVPDVLVDAMDDVRDVFLVMRGVLLLRELVCKVLVEPVLEDVHLDTVLVQKVLEEEIGGVHAEQAQIALGLQLDVGEDAGQVELLHARRSQRT